MRVSGLRRLLQQESVSGPRASRSLRMFKVFSEVLSLRIGAVIRDLISLYVSRESVRDQYSSIHPGTSMEMYRGRNGKSRMGLPSQSRALVPFSMRSSTSLR